MNQDKLWEEALKVSECFEDTTSINPDREKLSSYKIDRETCEKSCHYEFVDLSSEQKDNIFKMAEWLYCLNSGSLKSIENFGSALKAKNRGESYSRLVRIRDSEAINVLNNHPAHDTIIFLAKYLGGNHLEDNRKIVDDVFIDDSVLLKANDKLEKYTDLEITQDKTIKKNEANENQQERVPFWGNDPYPGPRIVVPKRGATIHEPLEERVEEPEKSDKSSIITVKSKDGTQSRKFVGVNKLVEALVEHKIPFKPVIENVDFSGHKFNQSEEDSDMNDALAADALFAMIDRINAAKARGEKLNNDDVLNEYDSMAGASKRSVTATFKNCKFDDTYFDVDMDIQADNCSFKKAHFEYCDVKIKGQNNDFTKASINEGKLKLDVKDCSFKGASFHKVHVSGNMSGGYLPLDGRIYLGQREALTLKDVDFGKKPFDYDYFFSDKLTVINPKLNANTRKEVEENFPGRIQTDNNSKSLTKAKGQEMTL